MRSVQITGAVWVAVGLAVVSLGGCFDENTPVSADTGGDSAAAESTTGTSTDDRSTGVGPMSSGSTAADSTAGTPDTTAADSDGAGPSGPTEPPPVIVAYGWSMVNGDLLLAAGGMPLRDYLDELCRQAPPFGNHDCTEARALVELGPGGLDNLGFPTDRPVVAPDDSPIAEGIGKFRLGDFVTTPSAAGVLAGGAEFWTGVGVGPANDCTGWSGVGTGAVGKSDATGPGWLSVTTRECVESRPLLCVCW